MKKLNSLLILVIFIFANSALAQSIIMTYNFENPELNIEKDGYTNIVYNNCLSFGKEGNPLMPHFGADILLPQENEIKSVKIIAVTYISSLDNIKIKPASRLFPTSKGTPEGYKPVPNDDIYNSPGPYPINIIENIYTQFLAGHSIGSFSICPVVYFPSDNQVKLLESITLEIETQSSEKAQKATRFLKNDYYTSRRIKQIVENPEQLSVYSYNNSRYIVEADILFITKESFIPAFEEYIEYKRSTGYIVNTVSTEDIYSQYNGQDEQEKIRNCIIDQYETFGISFVILGGDADPGNPSEKIVPHRGFFAIDDNNIPSDMYYSCLDGTWNDDGDNKWGEYGEYDLYAEVGIGRICVDSETEIENFTNKLKMYQNSPVIEDIEKALMIGEELNDNPWTFGGDYMDEIIDGTSNHGFTTAGFPESFSIVKLYDRDGGWNKYDVFDEVNNNGSHLLNHLGHSNVSYNMKMSTSDLNTNNFQNDGINRGFFIGYSQGCYNGSFDNRSTNGSYGYEDCFAEKITTIETAEVACIANSRYGWYAPGNTNSTSQYIHRQFCDAFWGEELFLIGHVNSDSKEDNASYFNGNTYMRYTVYETNLFGDPTLDIWTEIPQDIISSYPASISIGSLEIAFETNAPFARIGVFQNGNIIGRAIADNQGNTIVNFFEPVIIPDILEVSIIAHNKIRHQGSVVIVTNQPYVIYDSYEVVDTAGNGNGFVDFAESILLNLGVINVGDQPASDVEVILSTEDQYITITDQTEDYGDFEAGETIVIDEAFAFDVAANIPDGHVILFDIEAIGDTTWNSYFYITVNAPILSCGMIHVDDNNGGNGNGHPDPGETVDLIIESSNFGHSACFEAIGIISSQSNYVTINSDSYEIGTIEEGETLNAVFSITVDEATPVGTIVCFMYDLISGEYQLQKSYGLKAGIIVEDFESGDFNQYDWQFAGSADWTITSSEVYEGAYCAKSGNIGNNQSTFLFLTRNIMADDSISFYRKVSSEATYDFLKFFIDNTMQDQWSGEENWERVSFPVSAGEHKFTWVYYKDSYVSNGSDCGWIDYIVLPAEAKTTAFAGKDAEICAGDDYQLNGTATYYNSLEWTTSGDGIFDDNTILTPVYSPGDEDIINESVTLTLTAISDDTASNGMVMTINPLPVATVTGTTSICYGDSTQLIIELSGTAPWTIDIDYFTEIISADISPWTVWVKPEITTEYTILFVTDFNGCTNSGSGGAIITLFTSHPVEIVASPNDTVCINQPLTLDAGSEFSSYEWPDGSTGQTFTVERSEPGTEIFWVDAMDENGCVTSDTVLIFFKDCTGIAEDQSDIVVNLFPNPNNGNFIIDFETGNAAVVDIEIINQIGALVYAERNINVNGVFNKELKLNYLPDGIYYMIINGSNINISKKIIIQR